jgi:hypothetical protein
MSRVRLLALLLVLITVVLLSPALSPACPFCSGQGQTLTKEVTTASFVVYGTVSNARLSSNPDDFGGGTTDLTVESIIKPHDYLKAKKQLVLNRYIPSAGKEVKFLVFCEIFRDKVDAYRGIPSQDKDLGEYLKGAVELENKEQPKRLAFFFNWLDHADAEIGTDAYKEFANADYKDVIAMIEAGKPEQFRAKLVQWLRDPNTASYRYGLYGYLLGHVGKPEDVELYTELLNPKRALVSGLDGILAGYITLKPVEAWKFTREILGDSSADFLRRHSALRAVRFFWEYRQDVIKPKELAAATALLLEQGDIADLAIEDLRKWKQWDYMDQILGLFNRATHSTPIVQRAIIRFALSCENQNAKAKAFVEAQRKLDPERLKDIEELLKLDMPPASGGS